MSLDHALGCRSCGPLGWKRRQRARRAERVADAGHIAWAAQLAAESRSRRAGPDGLMASLDCRVLPPGRYERVVRIPALTLHTHTTDQPCRGAETGCIEYPGGETVEVTDILPEVDDATLEAINRDLTWYFTGPQGEGQW